VPSPGAPGSSTSGIAIIGAVLALASVLIFTIRWIEGSFKFQRYLERRKWVHQNRAPWRDADIDAQALVDARAQRIVDHNLSQRANSWHDAWLMLRGRHPSDLAARDLDVDPNAAPQRPVPGVPQIAPPARKPASTKSGAHRDDPKVLRQRIEEAGMPEEAREAALEEVYRLERIPKHHPEYSGGLTYVEWLLAMPWNVRSDDRLDLGEARALLDAEHFGMEKVKERVLEWLAVRKRTGAKGGAILCFVGPPGVGKTSIARAIAQALGRRFVRLALGGVSDESEIRGFRRTYTASAPGAVMTRMKRARTKNPVFLLDEVEKVEEGGGAHGNPKAALLELLDPEQHDTFRDRYLDVGFDMSEVIFVLTVNELDKLPGPLRDRVEIIDFSSYTPNEKVEIARRHALPEKQRKNGLAGHAIEVTTAALRRIVEGYTAEAGVRGLRRKLDALMRKITSRLEIAGTPVPSKIDEGDVQGYLGVAPYALGRTVDNGVGLASGLYVSDLGGGVTNVVVSAFPGRGEVILRKQMGEMMDDSVKNVMALIRSRAEALGIDPKTFRRSDIDVAFTPATKIDGPSAGITMALAIASRLSGRAVRKGIAMTGELTPDGRVLPIGGLKEKVLGAHRKGYKTVLYPAANASDAAEVPADVLAEIELVPVETIDQVLERGLEPPSAKP
ncbi:MAG TPA: S16 family serine protease, partial [Elusimicrobiota bacterium]|nr:S16 family serine protease [Elusimicrobiota bacterium]